MERLTASGWTPDGVAHWRSLLEPGPRPAPGELAGEAGGALVGGVIALKLSGLYLSVSASVGFFSLFRRAILYGLVLVAFFRKLGVGGQRLPADPGLGGGAADRVHDEADRDLQLVREPAFE